MMRPSQRYLSLRSLGAPAVLLSLAAQGVFRGFKDTTTPLFATGNTIFFICSKSLKQNKANDPLFFSCLMINDPLFFCSDWRCNKHNTRPDFHICFPPRRNRSSHCSCYIPVSLVLHVNLE